MNHKRTMSGKTDHPAGSPTADEPDFFTAGLIRRPHGVDGELLVDVFGHYLDQIETGKQICVGETHQRMKILSCRKTNSGFLIKLEGLDSPEQSGKFRLKKFYLTSTERSALPPGEYYPDQLLDLTVRNVDTGEELGCVSEIIETGANDVYVVSTPGRKELLLPAIKDVIKKVDIKNGEILIHLLPGLVDSLA